jgi:hypothetical protein
MPHARIVVENRILNFGQQHATLLPNPNSFYCSDTLIFLKQNIEAE